MKRGSTSLFSCGPALLLGCVLAVAQAQAQTTSTSSNLVAQPIPDRTVPFSLSAAGTAKPMLWGLDTAWPDDNNMLRGIAFMGPSKINLVRLSFQPTYPLVNGDLQQPQIDDLNNRMRLLNFNGASTQVTMNCDAPSVDASYYGNATNWAALMDATVRRIQATGRTVVSVAPFNEPDYSTQQGTQQDFLNIATALRNNTRFNNIRISGGNTLSTDAALPWYNFLKTKVNDGNTHELAGSFDSFANFYQTVRANGHYATDDEMHNVVEAMVGVEYGVQAGIWWGTAELARGEFAKASDGVRLAYSEHRPNWTAASVYRTADGRVQAFAGASERQAVATRYNFLSKERDVYYDGVGPQREYSLMLPGGTGYFQNQPNAERVLNITWGEDIQPAINGRYVLVNRASGKVMQVAGASTADGALIEQGTYTSATSQQWAVTPVDTRVGGDFSYFSIDAVHSGKAIDDLGYTLANGGTINQYTDNKTVNQQRYLEYAEDGWFRIRSRHSAKCLDIASNGVNVVQQDKNATSLSQQWRLLPMGAAIEFVAPAAPTNLVATANPESVRLSWTASPDTDLAGYTIFRAEAANGPFSTIARNVPGTSFVDNSVTISGQYYYKIKAVDKSLNRSAYSAQVTATTTGIKDLVAQLTFENSTLDNSQNLNHSAAYGGTAYAAGRIGSSALAFNGSDAFVQLPATLANQPEITVAGWVYFNGGGAWQRIFDLGNDQSQYMFLTPNNGSGSLRFAIKNGGAEQTLDAPALAIGTWTHVAITLGSTGARLFVNGLKVAESTAVTIRPLDFKPVLNYLGRSQYPDPLLNGRLDEFRIYNYALAPVEVATLAAPGSYLQVRNRNTGLYLDGVGRTTNGDNASQYANTTHPNSFWALREMNGGYYQLQNRNTGMFLDGMGRTTDGSVCGQWASTNNTNAQWAVEQFDGDYYRLRNRTTNLYLDGVGRTTDGSDVAQYANTTHPNAQWSFGIPSAARTALATQGATKPEPVQLYPNPVSDILHIRLTQGTITAQARILNVTGQVLRTVALTGPETKLPVANLSAGLYLVEVTTPAETTRLRFLKP
ncbi:RICIN domain-containing protein [Hymenobacter sp. M29]|uniref:RICIN domain-containing protein n=1 Tax=Hymenobacter mellowenesis TaxID=3063995 RepID=A0ABT9AF32_9BACT|nr:RICIN domain-containing protein [Hymenobacter sp. M29]MDO7848472.1 RICIN domain-containing protein [Hymenobacter sp. M29]